MSGLIGKAMRFARSPQGRQALSKAQRYAKSPEGRARIEQLRARTAGGKRKPPR